MLTRDEALRLFERRRDAWLAEDLEAYLALFAPDLTFRSPMHARPLAGRDAFAALVRASSARMRPVSFEFERLAVDGDDVLAEWRIRIAERATGRIVEYSGMSACRIADGLITWWREYWDPAELGLRR